jgi:hypothetical protein
MAHHALEVLHPSGARVHPFDTFLRNTCMGVGGDLVVGTLIYLLGMSFSIIAAAYAADSYGRWGCFRCLSTHTYACPTAGR